MALFDRLLVTGFKQAVSQIHLVGYQIFELSQYQVLSKHLNFLAKRPERKNGHISCSNFIFIVYYSNGKKFELKLLIVLPPKKLVPGQDLVVPVPSSEILFPSVRSYQ